jgi:glutamyl-tRNA synthetase
MAELIELFSLERVSKSGAKFDYEKGKWFNHKYLQDKSNDELAKLFLVELSAKGLSADEAKVAKVIGLVKERVNFVAELWGQAGFFFEAPTNYDEKTVQKRWKAETPSMMTELIAVLSEVADFSAHNTEETVKAWIAAKEYNMGAVMNAFRLSVVGESKGPHMFDITEIIGKQETIARIQKAIESINA